MAQTEPRIVITGVGSCSAAGDTAALWDAARTRASCLSAYQGEAVEGMPVAVVGAVRHELRQLFGQRVAPLVSRHATLGASALDECLNAGGLDDKQRRQTGLIFGSASQGLDRGTAVVDMVRSSRFDSIDPASVQCVFDAGACHLLGSRFGLGGYVHAVQGASCTGVVAMQTAINAIRAGECERVCCVSGEANLFPFTFLFYAMRARVDGVTSSFFGRVRGGQARSIDGHVVPFGPAALSDRGAIAEGGAAVLLETFDSARSRKAAVYAEVEYCGTHFHCDNHHGADPALVGLSTVIAPAVGRSVDSVYLPVTGSTVLDSGPCTVCATAFPGIHAFTVEPVIGHTGAATSLFNTVLGALSIHRQTLLPTHNLMTQSVAYDLSPEISPTANRPVNRILVVSSGWGGYNGAVSLVRHEH